MSLKDTLWGGKCLKAPSPEASSPVPPPADEVQRFIASAKISLRGLVSPMVDGAIIATDSCDAEKVWPEVVTHQESVEFFEEARRSVRGMNTITPFQGILDLEFPEE